MSRRLVEITVASVMLVVLVPLFLLVMLVIVLDSPGNPFYGGRRVGRGGAVFRMWKFRTMIRNADRVGPAIVTDRDPRVTRSGRILRRTRIDELPQLYNLLKGEVALVGPRAEVPEIVATYTPDQRRILEVRPGLTGAGTLHYLREQFRTIPEEGDADAFYKERLMDRKLRIDLDYARSQSAATDARILLQTAVEVVKKLWE